jgi:hypothetical protein
MNLLALGYHAAIGGNGPQFPACCQTVIAGEWADKAHNFELRYKKVM